MKITCDYCGKEIEIGNQSGLVEWEIKFDDLGRKIITNVGIYHKNVDGHICDMRRDSAWRDLDEMTGKDGIYSWLDILDPKYNHGENNKDAQFTTIDLSVIETMLRCLCAGYDEARHYALRYGKEELGLSVEPIITRENIKNILKYAKKTGLNN